MLIMKWLLLLVVKVVGIVNQVGVVDIILLMTRVIPTEFLVVDLGSMGKIDLKVMGAPLVNFLETPVLIFMVIKVGNPVGVKVNQVVKSQADVMLVA